MSAQALLKRFDIVADHSGNIPALRRLVVDLAVRGKLLRTDELDIDVQEMLRRISKKVGELTLAGLIKKQKPLAKIGNDEVPAAYLAHCAFARLGNIANLQKGLTGIQSSMPGEFPLVVTAAERGTCDHFDFDGAAAIIPLVSSTGHGNASINRLHYQDGKFALGTILCAVIPFDEQLISARFLYEYLTAFKEELLVSKMIGTANVTLTLGKIAEVPVPIIAPAVQRRVDELMALCDQLEAAQQERERRRDSLAAASLQRLNQPATDITAETQREHARFHLQHLPRLTTRPEHIKALRAAILDLAVRGKLVSQEAGDQPTAEAIPLFEFDGVLHSIPQSWFWASLGQLADMVTDGEHLTPPRIVERQIPLVTAKNVRDGEMDYSATDWVSNETAEKAWRRCRPTVGDILMVCVGATTGRLCILRKQHDMVLVRSVAVIRPSCRVCVDFLALAIRSPVGQRQIWSSVKVTAQPCLYINRINSLAIPLPPLAEQHRIVAKVDELMTLCDQLEAQLTTTQTDSSRLLEAVLEAALAPA